MRFCTREKQRKFWIQNPSLGKITKVDLQNPLKIVLFMKASILRSFWIINWMKYREINFSSNANPIVITATGIASQNQLWVYKSKPIGLFWLYKNNIKRYPPFSENIKHYQTDFNTFDWIDYQNDWYSCDAFGMITTKVKYRLWYYRNHNHQFIYSKSNKLFVDFKKTKNKIDISEKTFKNSITRPNFIYFTSKGIINYKITTP
jgi:hypothetical protein